MKNTKKDVSKVRYTRVDHAHENELQARLDACAGKASTHTIQRAAELLGAVRKFDGYLNGLVPKADRVGCMATYWPCVTLPNCYGYDVITTGARFVWRAGCWQLYDVVRATCGPQSGGETHVTLTERASAAYRKRRVNPGVTLTPRSEDGRDCEVVR